VSRVCSELQSRDREVADGRTDFLSSPASASTTAAIIGRFFDYHPTYISSTARDVRTPVLRTTSPPHYATADANTPPRGILLDVPPQHCRRAGQQQPSRHPSQHLPPFRTRAREQAKRERLKSQMRRLFFEDPLADRPQQRRPGGVAVL
jgi:hypothetical protein